MAKIPSPFTTDSPRFSQESIKTLSHPPKLEKYSRKEEPPKFRRSQKKLLLLGLFLVLLTALIGASLKKSTPSRSRDLVYLKASYPDFIGREKYLDILDRELDCKDFQNRLKIKVLWGKGGFGKSELAIEFANRHLSDFSLIWTFCCDTEEHMNQGYRHLAEKLGLFSFQDETSERVREKVHFYLENHRFDAPWLLIYDNVEKERIDYPQRGGSVLITSQRKILNSEFLLEIDSFSQEEALTLIEKITQEKRDNEMELLVDGLSGIPLLVNYVAHYIKATPGCSVKDYRQLLSPFLLEKEGPLWKENDVGSRYLKSLSASWQMPLQSLERENPLALEWLFLCSYLYPEQISEEWVDQWLGSQSGTPLKRMEILKALQNYGIIRYDQKTKTFSIHRFFQHMLRETKKSEIENYLGQAISLLSKCATNHHIKRTFWESGENWYLNACEINKWLTTYTPHFTVAEINLQQAIIYEGIAEWCVFKEQYKEALEANYKVLELLESANVQDIAALGKAHEGIAQSLYKLGRYAKALEVCNRAEILQSSIAEEHPLDYALTLNMKGLILWELGACEEALKYHKLALAIRVQQLGEMNSSVGFSVNNVALCLRDLGRYDEALEYGERCLTIYKQTCGMEHPWGLWALQNKGWILLLQDKPREAMQLFQQSVPPSKSLIISLTNHAHGSLAYALIGIGWTHIDLGEYKKAKKAFKKAIRIGLTHYSHNDRIVTRGYRGLGWAYIKNKRFEKGFECLLHQLALSTEKYQNAPKMVALFEEFHQALKEAADLGINVEKEARKGYELSRDTLGENHVQTALFKSFF